MGAPQKQPEDGHTGVLHIQTLRRAIGGVALGLPFVLAVGENVRDAILGSAGGARVLVEGSISAYFHTGMREVFVGSLCAIAVFLLCYKGYGPADDRASNLAGFSLLVVALFPTTERSWEAGDAGAPEIDSATFFSSALERDPRWVGNVHLGAAAVFFVTLALMSLFLFTRTGGGRPTREKLRRNRVYVACGATMLACIAAIGVGKGFASEAWMDRTSFVFWMESVAVVSFGLSWLTKAQVLLGDRSRGG